MPQFEIMRAIFCFLVKKENPFVNYVTIYETCCHIWSRRCATAFGNTRRMASGQYHLAAKRDSIGIERARLIQFRRKPNRGQHLDSAIKAHDVAPTRTHT